MITVWVILFIFVYLHRFPCTTYENFFSQAVLDYCTAGYSQVLWHCLFRAEPWPRMYFTVCKENYFPGKKLESVIYSSLLCYIYIFLYSILYYTIQYSSFTCKNAPITLVNKNIFFCFNIFLFYLIDDERLIVE